MQIRLSRSTLPTFKAHTPPIIFLPSELLVEILRHLNYQSILQCCLVCREFNKVIHNSTELQYCIELALDCMVDGPPSTLTVSDRLEQLRALRRAWSLFEWKKEVRVPMPGVCLAYELGAGVFAKIFPSENIINQLGSRHFISTWLPSSSDPGHTLVRNDIGVITRDFAIDPSQDLVVLVKMDETLTNESGLIEVYIRTISSNVQHPEAVSPILRTFTSFPVSSAFIQIVDDVVGMVFWSEPDGPCITIWNWKTGLTLVDRKRDHLPRNFSDFSFISRRAYMVTRGIVDSSIEIFTFGEGENDVVHVVRLLLPAMKTSARMVYGRIHTGAFVAKCPAGVPFWANQDERVYVLSIQYIQVDPDVGSASIPRFCLFFKNSTSLKYIRKYHEQRENIRPIDVPWEEWGPNETRMLYHKIPYQWLRYVHGHRVVFPIPSGNSDRQMQVMDFNIRKTKRQVFAAQTGTSSAKIEMVDYPSIISSQKIFRNPITTSLPYRVCGMDELKGFSGVMIDEHRLIGLKGVSAVDGGMKELHVFAL